MVFLTAYDQFALRAFDAQALDYLVKPVTQARFDATVVRLLRQLSGKGTLEHEPRISIATARGTLVLPVREIEWIEAADNYSRIWANRRGYLVREALSVLDERFAAHGFVRTHRQCMGRVSAIRRVVPGADNELELVLRSGARVPASRRRRAVVLEAVRGGGVYGDT